jgi:ParB-like chromosome segregation protein Spo0J
VPVLRVLPLTAIQFAAQNPRTDAAADLDELTASIAAVQEPYLAQLPLVHEEEPGRWRVIAGERRIRAVTAVGWQTVACLVYRRLDAATAHTLRVVENLHHKPLHLYDEGVALKLAWLMANARALDLTAEAQAILEHEQPPSVALEQLTAFLRDRGFVPTRPAVTWDEVLNTLGLDLSPAARKRRVRLVSVDQAIQAQAHDLQLSAAAMGAIGTLPEADQQRFMAELADDPQLARKARRIARTVRDQGYTLDQALAEARGQVFLPDSGALVGPAEDVAPATPAGEVSEAVSSAIYQLVRVAGELTTVAEDLRAQLGSASLATLPEPYNLFGVEALDVIRAATANLPS